MASILSTRTHTAAWHFPSSNNLLFFIYYVYSCCRMWKICCSNVCWNCCFCKLQTGLCQRIRCNCKKLWNAPTQIPLHNRCLIMPISQNGLIIIIEKMKVNIYVVSALFGMITSWANGDQLKNLSGCGTPRTIPDNFNNTQSTAPYD